MERFAGRLSTEWGSFDTGPTGGAPDGTGGPDFWAGDGERKRL